MFRAQLATVTARGHTYALLLPAWGRRDINEGEVRFSAGDGNQPGGTAGRTSTAQPAAMPAISSAACIRAQYSIADPRKKNIPQT